MGIITVSFIVGFDSGQTNHLAKKLQEKFKKSKELRIKGLPCHDGYTTSYIEDISREIAINVEKHHLEEGGSAQISTIVVALNNPGWDKIAEKLNYRTDVAGIGALRGIGHLLNEAVSAIAQHRHKPGILSSAPKKYRNIIIIPRRNFKSSRANQLFKILGMSSPGLTSRVSPQTIYNEISNFAKAHKINDSSQMEDEEGKSFSERKIPHRRVEYNFLLHRFGSPHKADMGFYVKKGGDIEFNANDVTIGALTVPEAIITPDDKVFMPQHFDEESAESLS